MTTDQKRTGTHVLNSTVVRHFPAFPIPLLTEPSPFIGQFPAKGITEAKPQSPALPPSPGYTTPLQKRGAHISIRGSCGFKKEGGASLDRRYLEGVSCYRLFRESSQNGMPKEKQFSLPGH